MSDAYSDRKLMNSDKLVHSIPLYFNIEIFISNIEVDEDSYIFNYNVSTPRKDNRGILKGSHSIEPDKILKMIKNGEMNHKILEEVF